MTLLQGKTDHAHHRMVGTVFEMAALKNPYIFEEWERDPLNMVVRVQGATSGNRANVSQSFDCLTRPDYLPIIGIDQTAVVIGRTGLSFARTSDTLVKPTMMSLCLPKRAPILFVFAQPMASAIQAEPARVIDLADARKSRNSLGARSTPFSRR